MMKRVKNILLLLVAMLVCGDVVAQTFFWEGIRFEVMSESPATVRLYKAQRCMASFSIPGYVEDFGQKYEVTTIGEEGFRYLDCVSDLHLGRVKVLEDGYYVYYSDNDTYSYYGSFAYCTNMRSVNFSELRYIGDYAFYGCRQLKAANMWKVETIGAEAFEDCTSLKTVVMGENMKSVGENCFLHCDDITSVRVESKEPPHCAVNAFGETVCNTAVLQVPSGTKAAYMKAEGWSRFRHIEEAAATAIGDVEGAADKVRLQQRGTTLLVEGMPEKSVVQVFDMKGTLVKSQSADGNSLQIELAAGNAYLVKVGQRTFKVAM